MTPQHPLSDQVNGPWLRNAGHLAWLRHDAQKQLDFFRNSLRPDGGFDTLNWDGTAQPRPAQELHTTTRLIHSYALGHAFGDANAAQIIDAGMAFLWARHRDETHGGYAWSAGETGIVDGQKLAYGHVFVLLAAASAKQADHPDADRLLRDISNVLDTRFWDEKRGLFKEEYHANWTAFSKYRGMNANMHGVEAMLAAFEATQDPLYLTRAGRILDFFVGQIAPAHGWRIPEHYTEDWQVDPDYAGNPMFRPAGSTPGHSFELGRLLIQHWDLSGRPVSGAVAQARLLIERAYDDAWLPSGGFCYTLDLEGHPDVTDRFWWPVTEAIGALAVLLTIDPTAADEERYRAVWTFAYKHLIDRDLGGWYPELDDSGAPTQGQFVGKPDIYHSLQAAVIPLAATPSGTLGRIAQATKED